MKSVKSKKRCRPSTTATTFVDNSNDDLDCLFLYKYETRKSSTCSSSKWLKECLKLVCIVLSVFCTLEIKLLLRGQPIVLDAFAKTTHMEWKEEKGKERSVAKGGEDDPSVNDTYFFHQQDRKVVIRPMDYSISATTTTTPSRKEVTSSYYDTFSEQMTVRVTQVLPKVTMTSSPPVPPPKIECTAPPKDELEDDHEWVGASPAPKICHSTAPVEPPSSSSSTCSSAHQTPPPPRRSPPGTCSHGPPPSTCRRPPTNRGPPPTCNHNGNQHQRRMNQNHQPQQCNGSGSPRMRPSNHPNHHSGGGGGGGVGTCSSRPAGTSNHNHNNNATPHVQKFSFSSEDNETGISATCGGSRCQVVGTGIHIL